MMSKKEPKMIFRARQREIHEQKACFLNYFTLSFTVSKTPVDNFTHQKVLVVNGLIQFRLTPYQNP